MSKSLNVLSVLASVVVVSGCEQSSHASDFTLEYRPPTTRASTPSTLGPCHFAGPHQTVVLVSLLEDVVPKTFEEHCSGPPRQPYETALVEVLEVAQGTTLGLADELKVSVGEGIWWPARSSYKAGDTHLMSLRQTGGDWFVEAAVPVTILPSAVRQLGGPNSATSPPTVALPPSWAALSASVKSHSQDFRTMCGNDSTMLFTDEEYSDLVWGGVHYCSNNPVIEPGPDAGSNVGITTSDLPDAGE